MRKIHVSVIIPTHNRRGLVTEAVKSVLEQDFADFELVMVDDGSTDGTADDFADLRDGRLMVLRQENRGVSAARNAGVAVSSGALVAFLDSDDIWLPGKLSAQVRFFDSNPKISICQTEELWVRNGRRVNPRKKHAKRSGWIFRHCLPLCIVSPSAVMMRRSAFDVLGGFDESMRACEDYDLWLRASLRYEIVTPAEPLIVKRGGHDVQLSRQWGLDRCRIYALEKILADPALDPGMRGEVIAEINRRSEIVAQGALKRGRGALAEKIMKRCR